MAVVRAPVAVEGDPDLDVVLAEEVEIAAAELQAVGMDPEIEFGDRVEGSCQLLADTSQSCGSCQKRLPSVQDH